MFADGDVSFGEHLIWCLPVATQGGPARGKQGVRSGVRGRAGGLPPGVLVGQQRREALRSGGEQQARQRLLHVTRIPRHGTPSHAKTPPSVPAVVAWGYSHCRWKRTVLQQGRPSWGCRGGIPRWSERWSGCQTRAGDHGPA